MIVIPPFIKTPRKVLISVYNGARVRCKCPSKRNTKYYISKGIKFLLSYPEFFAIWDRDGADKLKKPSIHRNDSKGNYELSNCKIIEWEQNRILRSNIKREKYGFVRVSDETLQELKTLKAKTGISIRRIIEKILAYYKKNGGK